MNLWLGFHLFGAGVLALVWVSAGLASVYGVRHVIAKGLAVSMVWGVQVQFLTGLGLSGIQSMDWIAVCQKFWIYILVTLVLEVLLYLKYFRVQNNPWPGWSLAYPWSIGLASIVTLTRF